MLSVFIPGSVSTISQGPVFQGPRTFTAATAANLGALTIPGWANELATNYLCKDNDLLNLNYSWEDDFTSIQGIFTIVMSSAGVVTLVPFANASFSEESGLAMTSSTATTMTFSPGAVTDSTNSQTIIVPTATTVDLATNGLNGLDTGTVAANTPIYVYAIADSSDDLPAGLIASINEVAPTLPTGYDRFALVFATFTINASATLPLMRTSGNNANGLLVQYETIIAVVSGGTAATFTAVDLTTPVRALPSIPGIQATFSAQNSAAGTSAIRPTGNTTATSANAPFRLAAGGLATGWAEIITGTNVGADPSIDYLVSAGNVSIYVNGYTMVV